MKIFIRVLLTLCFGLSLFASQVSVANGFNVDWLNGRTLYIQEDEASHEVLKATFTSDHVSISGVYGGYNQPYTIVNGIIKIDESGVLDDNVSYPTGSYQYVKILKIDGKKIIVSDTMDYDEAVNQVFGDGKDIDLIYMYRSTAQIAANAINAYGFNWFDRKDAGEKYARPGYSVDFNDTSDTFKLVAPFVKNEDSRAAIKTYLDHNYATSISAVIKPIQMNPYSRAQLITSADVEDEYHITVGINIVNNGIYYWASLDNDSSNNYLDVKNSGVDNQIASFSKGTTDKSFDTNITIVNNTIVYKVKDLNTNTMYSKTFDFSKDLNSSVASIYLSQTGKILSIKDKLFKSIEIRSRTDHRYGGDASEGNTTIVEVLNAKTKSTSFDAYGFMWKNMKYRRGDARYLGDNNSVDFDSSSEVFTLKAGFKQTDTNKDDNVDERDSRAAIRVKDYINPVSHVSTTIRPIQSNPYSWYQITSSIWEEVNNTGIYTSLGITKNSAKIYLGYVRNDGSYASFKEEEIATYANDTTGKKWNLDINIVGNNIIYTVKDLDDNSTTVKVVNFSTDLNSTATAIYQADKGEIVSIKNRAFNITSVRTRTEYLNGGDTSLGGTTIMKVYDIKMNNDSNTTTQNLILQQGWNLVSLPTDITLSSQDLLNMMPNALDIWKYKNGKWLYASRFPILLDQAAAQNIAQIENLSAGEGFWVYNAKNNDTITLHGIPYSILSKTNLLSKTDQWLLLGTGVSLQADKIMQKLIGREYLWTYLDGKWGVWTSNQEQQSTIDLMEGVNTIKDISNASGFWVH